VRVLYCNCPINLQAETCRYKTTIIKHRKQAGPWAYGKEKIREAERNLPDFSDCSRVVKTNFPENLSKIVVDGGWVERSDYEKFLLDTIFPTKLTEFAPFIFIISQYCPTGKRILPDWLCLPNKLGGCRHPPPGTPIGRTILYYYCSHWHRSDCKYGCYYWDLLFKDCLPPQFHTQCNGSSVCLRTA
jgi:hypothetical protein